jgi:hypothetical protein
MNYTEKFKRITLLLSFLGLLLFTQNTFGDQRNRAIIDTLRWGFDYKSTAPTMSVTSSRGIIILTKRKSTPAWQRLLIPCKRRLTSLRMISATAWGEIILRKIFSAENGAIFSANWIILTSAIA